MLGVTADDGSQNSDETLYGSKLQKTNMVVPKSVNMKCMKLA